VKALARAADWVDDRLNPIVVKELRQAVQGRFVVAVLFLFLLVSLVTTGGILMSVRVDDVSSSPGRWVLTTLQGILVATCLLFLPLYATVRLAAERSDVSVDLLFATTLSPWAVVRGKLFATLLLAVLIYSACMPFMTVTFLLRGVDLPTIALVLATGFVAVTVGIQAGIAAACITTHRGFRVVLGLALLVGLGFLYSGTMGMSFAWAHYGAWLGPSPAQFWAVTLTSLEFALSGLVILHVASVSLLSPPSANRALPLRITATAVWLVNGVIGAVWSLTTTLPGNEEDLLAMWSLGSAALFSGGFLVAVCEREELGSRVTRRIPRSLLARLAAFLFYSGAAGGVAWSTLGAGVSIAVVALWRDIFAPAGISRELVTIPAGLFLYTAAYGLTALLVRRKLLGRWLRPEHTWLLAAALAALGTALPVLAAFFLFGPNAFDRHPWCLLGCPLALVGDREEDFALYFTAAWALAVGLVQARWFGRQVVRFRRPEAPARPAIEAAAPAVPS
jgi:hypothetical protein